MEADIHQLFESDFYRILDFKCRCQDCKTSKPEYSEPFCISFVRKGNFLFNVFRHSLDSYTGCVLITKPGCERTVTHVHTVPDECTIIEFKRDFFERVQEQYPEVRFLFNPDLHSTLVKINPATEYIHAQIIDAVLSKNSKLQVDNLVMELIETVLGKITDYHADFSVYNKMKKNHLITIELAKEFISQNFRNNISLMEIAEHCCVSPFHFSRIFKALTFYSPHQFLLLIRLKNAEMQLRNTSQLVADIAFSSGFNNIEHFNAAFKNHYRYPPARFRSLQSA